NASVGCAGEAHRDRRRLRDSAQLDAQGLGAAQHARWRRPRALGNAGCGAARLLVLAKRRTEDIEVDPGTQRAQTVPRRMPALLAAALTFVSFAGTLVSVTSRPGVAAAARPGMIRGRVELRRQAALPERRPGVADLGTAPARDLPDLLRSVVYL